MARKDIAVARVNISAVWDRATEFLGDNIALLMPIAVPFVYLPQLVQGIIQPLSAVPSLATIAQLVGFAMVLVGLWGQLQLLALAIDPARGAADARGLATSRVAVVIGISALLVVALMLLAAPIGIALGIAGFDFQAVMQASTAGTPVPPPANMTPGIALFLLGYSLALLIVLIWASARLLMVNAAILAERAGFGAIARSFSLTRGNSLALIGVLLLYSVVSFVATLAAQSVFGAVLRLIIGGDGPITVASVITAAVVAGVATAFALLFNAFTGKYYVAARAQEAAGTA